MDFKEEEALHYIDLALDLDKGHYRNWNIKAIILEGMKRYKESEYCYDISLNLSFDNLVCDNKVRMLYDWASQLIEDYKISGGLNDLEEAKEINLRAINTTYELSSSASELQEKIPNTAEGIYLLSLQRYANIPFLIGRIIK